MRKIALFSVVALFCGTLSAEVSLNEPQKAVEVKQWLDIATDGLEDFITGKRPEWIVECKEGMVLPVSFDCSGDFFVQLDQQGVEENAEERGQPVFSLRTTSHLYMRCVDGVLLLSEDLTTWSRCEDFFAGNLSLSITDKVHVILSLRRRPPVGG